ncbi:MAG TPA: mannose-6-phosphate isomerase, class I [Terrimesophilobacter sp.]|nr:mannose-6-phosphate isomerase, class I [Terrimesophilobacter sp.]
MFVAIANTPRDYAWGSTTAMPELWGTTPTGRPEAELWLGAHPGSPARILDPSAVGGSPDLAAWIETEPRQALGHHPRLPFLMKVLAASAPLSLQAHPTAAQAREGFARENGWGIPLDAPHRNYRDAYPKPEIIYALSDRFEALCGFRPHDQAVRVFTALGLEELTPRIANLPELFASLMARGANVGALIARAIEAASSWDGADDVVSAAADTVRILAQAYPGDAGIVCALLLNRVTLRRGQSLYLAAGNIHAYLSGVGIEVMTASDNVLRGGLTPKHVDVPELLRVLDFTAGPPPWLTPDVVTDSLEIFRPGTDDFVLAHVTGDAEYPLSGPAIALCTTGSFRIDGARARTELSRGDAVYITPEESALSIAGSGELFVATTP